MRFSAEFNDVLGEVTGIRLHEGARDGFDEMVDESRWIQLSAGPVPLWSDAPRCRRHCEGRLAEPGERGDTLGAQAVGDAASRGWQRWQD
jgi:hypothetical protein